MTTKASWKVVASIAPLLLNTTISSAQQVGPQNLPSGQADTGTNVSPLTKPATQQTLPDSGTPDGYLFNLRPLGESLGQKLADKGIYITGRTLQQAVGETSGGIKRGTFYEGFNLLGVDLDMNRIAGIQGGSIHFLADDLAGLPFQTYSGSQYVFNRAYAYTAAARLSEFSYEQSFFNKRLDLRVGRLEVGQEFDYSPVYCEFLYGLCATPNGYAFVKGYAAYLASTTAGIAKVDLGHHFYFNTAFYEDEPSIALQGHLGFPGEDWQPNKWRGVTIPMQIGYRTTFKDDPYPRAFSIGGFVDTGDYADPIANAAGRNRLLSGGAPRVDHGKTEVYLQAEQTIWRPNTESFRNVLLFGGANFQTSGEANINSDYFAGISYRQPFASRPNDTFNVVGQIINLNPNYTLNVDTNLALRGIHQGVSSTERFIEVNYGIALAPGVTLKPNFEYIWNPDQVGFARPSASLRHSEFVGVALSAFVPETLGLPRLGGS